MRGYQRSEAVEAGQRDTDYLRSLAGGNEIEHGKPPEYLAVELQEIHRLTQVYKKYTLPRKCV
jgi:hypothetical protein